MEIRAFTTQDAGPLYEVFTSAIHGIASADYSLEQVAAWAPPTVDMSAWTERMTQLNPLVMEDDGVIIAYAALLPHGYIDDFYVSAAYTRRGVGTTLMKRILANASELGLGELVSDVSVTAQSFFAKFGFRIVERRTPVVRGIAMPNARMVMSLAANQPLHPELLTRAGERQR